MTKMTLSEELKWRGFVNQTTYKDIAVLDSKPITFYLGVDPSAKSMQIGNLAIMMMIKHFIHHGHKAILLVGGATGMIGDPDGKDEERTLKTLDEISANKQAISRQYKQLFGDNFTLVDNYDWFKDMGYLQFLREVGKHVPMRQMLGRDFVETRLSEDGAGISYAEFSYVLIQAYDFLYMNKKMGVTLQLCGSDQWGNSIAGVDLIRRINGTEAHVWSAPLVVNKTNGKKFGKSEDGAVWLDPEMTSVYQFYQFWLNLDDEGVGDYLKIYTQLDQAEHGKLMKEFEADKAGRLAQKTLAYETTSLVHGQDKAKAVKRVSEVLFGKGSFLDLTHDEVAMLSAELTVVNANKTDSLTAILVSAGLATSNTEANNFINSGAISINGQKTPTEDGFRKGTNLLKRGKNSFAIINLS